MPSDISPATASPNPIAIPGSSTVSYSITGTAGTVLEIEYSLSPANDILFTETHSKNKKRQLTLQGVANINESLSFTAPGNTQTATFFLSIRATNKSNSFSKSRRVQIKVQ